MKKLLSLVAVVMLGIGFIGCGGAVDNSAEESDHVPDMNEAPTDDTAATPPNDAPPPPP